MSADQEKQLRSTFDQFDKDKSGAIDKKELRESLKKLGKFCELEISAILTEADVDKSGTISFSEFSKYVAPRLFAVRPLMGDIKVTFDVSLSIIHAI